jgi:hypothetical protein
MINLRSLNFVVGKRLKTRIAAYSKRSRLWVEVGGKFQMNLLRPGKRSASLRHEPERKAPLRARRSAARINEKVVAGAENIVFSPDYKAFSAAFTTIV